MKVYESFINAAYNMILPKSVYVSCLLYKFSLDAWITQESLWSFREWSNDMQADCADATVPIKNTKQAGHTFILCT